MVSETVMRILSECTAKENTIFINSGQLDRPTYEAVNKVLDALGGKWNRKAKGHTFDYDPADALASVVSTGEVPDKNPLAYFPTPAPVIERMFANLIRYGLDRIRTVLEPSAGDGAIVAALRELVPAAKIIAVEVDQRRAQKLRDRSLPNVEIVETDFLQWQTSEQIDAVVMNPPFRTPAQPLAYLDHIEHALSMRPRSGILVSVTPTGWQFSGNRKRLNQFRETVEEQGYVRPLPDDAFAESGTGVRTCLVGFD